MKKILLKAVTLLTGFLLLTACTDASDLFGEQSSSETTVVETTTVETTETTTIAAEDGTATSSSLDIQAIANLDFSSIEGTYPAEGGEFIINGQTISFNKEDGVFPTDARSGSIVNGVAKVATNSAFYYFVPAGVVSPESLPEGVAEEDINRDRVIVSGNGMNIFYLD